MSNPFEAPNDSYNPFAMDNNSGSEHHRKSTPNSGNETNQSNFQSNPGSYTNPKGPETQYDSNLQSTGKITDKFTNRDITLDDIIKREKELEEREAKIRDLEKKVSDARANGTTMDLHPRNYPLLLRWYRYYPDEEIPGDARAIMKMLYVMHYVLGVLLLFNSVCCFCTLVGGGGGVPKSPTTLVILSVAYLILLFPCSFGLIIMSLYKALSQQSAPRYVLFLLNYLGLCAFIVFLCLGLGNFGSLGYINAINLLSQSKGKWVGGLAIFYSAVMSLFLAFIIYLGILILRYFKDHKFDKRAKTEFAKMAANYASEHKEDIARYAMENPEVAIETAKIASSGI